VRVSRTSEPRRLARWAKASVEVPHFYRVAVRRGAREGTDVAGTMRRRIQLIGNCASISDGKFVASERETASRYVGFLEEFAEGWREEAPTESQGDAPSGSEVPVSLRSGSGA